MYCLGGSSLRVPLLREGCSQPLAWVLFGYVAGVWCTVSDSQCNCYNVLRPLSVLQIPFQVLKCHCLVLNVPQNHVLFFLSFTSDHGLKIFPQHPLWEDSPPPKRRVITLKPFLSFTYLQRYCGCCSWMICLFTGICEYFCLRFRKQWTRPSHK